jgi:hypothetical protein
VSHPLREAPTPPTPHLACSLLRFSGQSSSSSAPVFSGAGATRCSGCGVSGGPAPRCGGGAARSRHTHTHARTHLAWWAWWAASRCCARPPPCAWCCCEPAACSQQPGSQLRRCCRRRAAPPDAVGGASCVLGASTGVALLWPPHRPGVAQHRTASRDLASAGIGRRLCPWCCTFVAQRLPGCDLDRFVPVLGHQPGRPHHRWYNGSVFVVVSHTQHGRASPRSGGQTWPRRGVRELSTGARTCVLHSGLLPAPEATLQ